MKAARDGRYGIPALSVDNEHGLRAALAAAEEKKSPIILIFLKKTNPDPCYFGRIVSDLAYRATVPVSICLDHSSNFEDAVWGIRAGFSDIMVDRSTLPYEENVKEVKELVRIAHAVNVGVEAELGHVGLGIDYKSDEGLTNPEEAIRFVEDTGVDALAVAVGTAHGIYKGTPKLHFDLLKELREKLRIPLVLHGGSGTGDDNLRKTCQMGICKVNIAFDLKQAMYDAIQAKDLSGVGLYGMYSYMTDGYKNKAMELIDMCGCAGKA
jgi:fructose-bisphosphate aldolase class II